jgi:DNA-3-methyladenine glycosylase II
MAHLGPVRVPLERNRFRALAESIIYQQLAGSAAASIARKVRALYGGRFPTADELKATRTDRLRSAGVSPQKLGYLRDLSDAVATKRLDLARVARMEDEAVIEALTEVHGIGRWTAEMFLIFSLGRPDVLPVGDYGVQKGVQQVYGFKSLPRPRTLRRVGAPWAPFRSAGTWYMWKCLDTGREPGLR